MGLHFDRLSVLVVEDTLPMQKLLCSVLQTLGVGRVLKASDGERGFSVFQEECPDIVLSDWHMEPVHGLDLIHEIRRNPLSRNRMVPIILVTGYNARPRVALARDSGATEYLVKPFSADDLARRIAYVINRPRDFVDNLPNYFGPDRRRTKDAAHNGPRRRRDDFNQ
ncbi:MAG: response regulator [Alphaproteobacteria bacterium]|nr:response regulator [Alphaproteobacteria bacterium]